MQFKKLNDDFSVSYPAANGQVLISTIGPYAKTRNVDSISVWVDGTEDDPCEQLIGKFIMQLLALEKSLVKRTTMIMSGDANG